MLCYLWQVIYQKDKSNEWLKLIPVQIGLFLVCVFATKVFWVSQLVNQYHIYCLLIGLFILALYFMRRISR